MISTVICEKRETLFRHISPTISQALSGIDVMLDCCKIPKVDEAVHAIIKSALPPRIGV